MRLVQGALNREAAVGLIGPRQVGKTTLARALKRVPMALAVALLAIAGCGRHTDANGCSSTQFVVTFPQAIDPGTTVQVTIGGHVHELVCPQEGAFTPVTEGYASIYLPVTGGGIGYCSITSFTIYLEDTPPSEIVNVSIHAQDVNGITVFDSPVTFLAGVEMPDHDGMPGVCYIRQQR